MTHERTAAVVMNDDVSSVMCPNGDLMYISPTDHDVKSFLSFQYDIIGCLDRHTVPARTWDNSRWDCDVCPTYLEVI